jgi:hypothetical protein
MHHIICVLLLDPAVEIMFLNQQIQQILIGNIIGFLDQVDISKKEGGKQVKMKI